MSGRQEDHNNGSVGRIELELAVLLRHAAGARRAIDERLERSAYLLLSVLTGREPASVNALADRLGLNASTITRQVDAMEREGLVTRVKHPTDGRVTLVEVTDVGVAQFAAERAARRRFYESVTASWSPEDRRDLARLLARLNSDLEGLGRSPRGSSADGDEDADEPPRTGHRRLTP